MQVIWLPRARADLSHARLYIREHNPSGAARVYMAIRIAVRGLAANPHQGRPGRVDGTRELVVPRTPYIVAYSVNGDRLMVTAVMHGAQDWPEGFA